MTNANRTNPFDEVHDILCEMQDDIEALMDFANALKSISDAIEDKSDRGMVWRLASEIWKRADMAKDGNDRLLAILRPYWEGTQRAA